MSKFYIGNKLAFDPDTKLEKVELTQAQYDALPTKKDNVLYLITDAVNPLEEIEDKIDTHLENNTPGLSHIPSGGSEGNILMYDSDGKARWAAPLGIEETLAYGVSWKPNVSDPELTRIGNIALHKSLPIQSGMKGCVYNPKEKKVIYWLNESDWRFRKEPLMKEVDLSNDVEFPSFTDTTVIASLTAGQFVKAGEHIGKIFSVEGNSVNVEWLEDLGDISADLVLTTQLEIGSRLDGYDGEVMVYVPEFYIRSWDEEDYRAVKICSVKIDDTWEHQPALFMGAYKDTVLNTVPANMGYLSTLEANTAISVANNAAYCRGGNGDPTYDSASDVFKRNLGKCKTAVSRSTFRAYERKVNKEIMSYRQYKNILYWLWVIEYANFNSQASFNPELTAEGFHQGGMGAGLTNVTNWGDFNNGNPITPNGYTNEIGNGTGIRQIGSLSSPGPAPNGNVKAIRWRGIENPFGDTWTNVDGIIIYADADNTPSGMNHVYTTDDPSKYADNALVNMTLSGLEVHTDGYTKEWNLGTTAEIIPRLMGGDATQYKCDYHWTGSKNTTLRTLLLGGYADNGTSAGLGYFASGIGVAHSDAYVGFRSVSVV